MNRLKTNVLVIGGGPAGATSARFLSQAGLDTILIDKDFGNIKPCGGGMASTALEDLELPSSLIKKELRKIKIVSPKGRDVTLTLTGGFMAMVERGEFDRALREMAQKNGANLIEASFEKFKEIGDKVVAVVTKEGETFEIEASYAIAADGVNSRVRAGLAIKPVSSILTIGGRLPDYDSDECEFWFGRSHAPGCYSWVFPHGGHASVGTGTIETPCSKELLDNFLKRRGLAGLQDVRGYRIPLWDGKLFYAGNRRILFVGDSAGQVMPLTFEGIYYSMKSAYYASTAISEERPELYERLWHERFGSRFFFMKKIWSLFMKRDRVVERFVALFEREDIRSAAVSLWLDKKGYKGKLSSFIRLIGKFFH